MKKVLFYGVVAVLLVLGALLFFRNCEGDTVNREETPGIIARLQGGSLTSSTIIIKTDSLAWASDSTLEVGVCWNLTGNPLITDSLRRTTYKGKQIILNIGTSLEAGNKYYVRAYLKGKKGVTYTEQFPLLAPKPREMDVSSSATKIKKVGISTDGLTADESKISSQTQFVSTYQNEASFKVVIDGKISGKVIRKGVVFGVSKSPTLAYNSISTSLDSSSITGVLPNLMPNKSYYVRPFIITKSDTLYGTVEKLTTLKIDVPVVVEPSPVAFRGSSIILNNEVVRDGGAVATERGVCWSKDANPSIDDAHLIDSLSSGIGKSSVVIGELEYNTAYYFRTYASNGVGTAYSSTVKVYTPVGVIGDLFGGGIIFYLDGSGRHGAVCAEKDQGSGVHWLEALMICKQLDLNGYTDWVLPTKEELDLMYTNLYLSNVGQLSNYYWSSTESDFNDAWYWRMNYGTPFYNFKGNVLNIRAVRRF